MKLAQLLTFAVVIFAAGCLVTLAGEQLGISIYHEVASLVPATGSAFENPYAWMVTAGKGVAIVGPAIIAILALLVVTTNHLNPDDGPA